MEKAILLLVLIASGLSAVAQIKYADRPYYKVGDYYYRIISDSTVELAPMQCPDGGVCDSYGSTVAIPATVTIGLHTFTVTRIGYDAFNHAGSVRSLTLPSTITEIADYAFRDLTIPVALPDSVRSIGASAFPQRLTNNQNPTIHIPRFVEHINETAFYGTHVYRFTVDSANRHFVAVDSVALCNADTTLLIAYANDEWAPQYTLPSTIRRIAESAFDNNRYLHTLILPDGLREIGAFAAFSTPLNALHIPASVRLIEGALRDNPPASFNLTVDPASTHYRMADNQLMSHNGDTLIQVLGATGQYTVPDGVRVLAPGLFIHAPGLTQVDLPNGITTIGAAAFAYSPTSVNLPSSIQYIGEQAFINNTGTKHASLPNLTYMGNKAFYYSYIETIDSLYSLRLIPPSAFSISRLRSINMGDQVEALGEDALSGISVSPSAWKIPSSLRRIGQQAINPRSRASRITLRGRVDTIGNKAFNCRVLYLSDTVVPVCYGTPLKNVDSVYVPCGHLDAFERAMPHDSTTSFAEWCPPVGITNPAALQLSFYPNPTDGPVSITLAEPAPAGSRLALLDATGRQMLRQNLLPGSQQLTLTLQQLPTGIYFLTLTTPNASTTHKLLLTRRQ